MMTNPEAPPSEKKKMTNPRPHLPLLNPQKSSLFSSLPDEIVLSILARIPRSYYRSICLVSKRFYSLLSSPEIYTSRSSIGATEPRIYVCLWSPGKHEWFTLTVIKGLLGLVPISPEKSVSVSLSPYQPATRFNSTNVVAGSEIYKIGGMINGERSRDVFLLDCRTHMWRSAPNMRVSRAGAKSCFLDGKIYVIGGYKKTKEQSMNWGEVFDLKTQTWKLLPSPSDEEALDSNHEIEVFGTRLYIITKRNHYVYDPKERRWLTKVGFMDMEPITGTKCGSIEKVMEHITVCEVEDRTISTHYQMVASWKPLELNTGPWCVIGNVMFSHYKTKYNWYCSRRGKWINIEGLNDLYEKRCYIYSMIELVNYGGKLLILWYECLQNSEKKTWCAVIRLEDRTSPSLGFHIWGEVEHCNVIVPLTDKYHHLSSCECVLL